MISTCLFSQILSKLIVSGLRRYVSSRVEGELPFKITRRRQVGAGYASNSIRIKSPMNLSAKAYARPAQTRMSTPTLVSATLQRFVICALAALALFGSSMASRLVAAESDAT